MAFWYLDPAGTDPYPAVPVSERVGYCIRPPVFHAQDVIETESLTFIKPAPGVWAIAERQDAADAHIPIQIVSNDAYLWVRIKDIGQKCEFDGLKVEKPGKYDLQVRTFKAPQAGIFQFAADGVPVGTPVDLYSPNKVEDNAQSPDTMITPGQVELTAGEYVFSVTLVGKNENAKTCYQDCLYCNLDYLKLVPAK